MVRKARSDPAWFIENVLGARIWDKQRDIAASVRDNKRTSVASCHGSGKSFIAAHLAIWFVTVFYRAIVATTAPTFRQVQKVLWSEMRSAVLRSRDALGGELLSTEYRLGEKWYAFGFATSNPDRFQGLHSKHLLLILDEAAGVDPKIYEAMEGILTSEHCRLLLIGNPTVPSGPFYQSFRNPAYKNLHISAFDIPNVKQGWPVVPGLTTADWVEDKKTLWGVDSPAYISRVLGRFPSTSEWAVISLAWVEAAQSRWLELYGPDADTIHDPGPLTALGVDVGRGGDRTVMAHRHGLSVLKLDENRSADTMIVTGLVAMVLQQNQQASCVVDVIGIGAGVVDRLREQGHDIDAFNAAAATPARDLSGELGFVNKRSAAWWNLREILDPANGNAVALPPHESLLGDLTAPRWKPHSGGKIQVESKDEIKKRLGRSTDDGDAVVQAFWEDPEKVGGNFGVGGDIRPSAWRFG